jgi:hypothetical protein
MDMNWKEEVYKILKDNEKLLELDERHRGFVDLINTPLGFNHSKPKEVGKASASNNGETKWQRELYESEPTSVLWYDIELPIGQKQSPESRWINTRVDMIGELDGRPIICELKKCNTTEDPLDALIQLLAYYSMIKQNARDLDIRNIHHTNARNGKFRWVDIANNPILMLLADEEGYWSYWEKSIKEPRKKAFNAMMDACKRSGVEIQIWNERGLRK